MARWRIRVAAGVDSGVLRCADERHEMSCPEHLKPARVALLRTMALEATDSPGSHGITWRTCGTKQASTRW